LYEEAFCCSKEIPLVDVWEEGRSKFGFCVEVDERRRCRGDGGDVEEFSEYVESVDVERDRS